MRALLLSVHLGFLLNDVCYDVMSLNGDVTLATAYYKGRAQMSPASEYLRQAPFALGTAATAYACFTDPQSILPYDIGAAVLMGLSTIGAMSVALYRAEVVDAKHVRVRELLVHIGRVNCMLVCILFAAATLLMAAERWQAIETKREEEFAKMKMRLAAKARDMKKSGNTSFQEEEEDYRLDEN